MKYGFWSKLRYDWVIYVAVALVAAFGWYFAFGIFNAPSDTETLRIFLAGRVEDASIKEVIMNSIDGVLLVEISTADPSDGNFSTKYSVVGVNGSDVVIVPESIAEMTDCASTFVAEPMEGCDYFQGGVAYGKFLSDEVKTALKAYFDFTAERYVVLVVASSPNAGAEGGTENALKLMSLIACFGQS